MPPNTSILDLWIKFLKKQLREPAKRLERELPAKLADASSIKVAAPKRAMPAAAQQPIPQRRPAAPSIDQPTTTASQEATLKRRKQRTQASIQAAQSPVVAAVSVASSSLVNPHAVGHHAAGSVTSGSSSSSGPVPVQVQVQGARAASPSISVPRPAHTQPGPSSAVNSGAGHHQREKTDVPVVNSRRFKRCYYVPVINPLPDLKDKQIAVVDQRLWGIRDMPAFREQAPTLPPSVLTTAKLRGLKLYDMKDMMDAFGPELLVEKDPEEAK